jgi:hypothetical protein
VAVIGHGMAHNRGEIELTVAVRMGARKLEESPRWRIQKM